MKEGPTPCTTPLTTSGPYATTFQRQLWSPAADVGPDANEEGHAYSEQQRLWQRCVGPRTDVYDTAEGFCFLCDFLWSTDMNSYLRHKNCSSAFENHPELCVRKILAVN